MLTKEEIVKRLNDGTGKLAITPSPLKIGPNSVDLTLQPNLLIYGTEVHRRFYQDHRNFISYQNDPHIDPDVLVFNPKPIPPNPIILDPKKKNPTQKLTIPESGLLLYPGKLYLGATVEYTVTEDFIPGIEGVSSVARLGVFPHFSAGFGDTGFRGVWVLEIVAHEPVIVYPYMRIVQIYYNAPVGKIEPYEGKYAGQTEPVASQSWKDYT